MIHNNAYSMSTPTHTYSVMTIINSFTINAHIDHIAHNKTNKNNISITEPITD